MKSATRSCGTDISNLDDLEIADWTRLRRVQLLLLGSTLIMMVAVGRESSAERVEERS